MTRIGSRKATEIRSLLEPDGGGYLRFLFFLFATVLSVWIAGCSQTKSKIKATISIGKPVAVLTSAIDVQRVAQIVPAEDSYVNSSISSELTVAGTCITGSAAVSISLVSTNISLSRVCDAVTGAFSGQLDVSGVTDGKLTLSIEFLNDLVNAVPVYVTQRSFFKDTSAPPAFTMPSTLNESSSTISINAVEGAVLYRATFTPVSGGSAIRQVESSGPSISVASLDTGTTYTVSVVALDAAGNPTTAGNTGTFTKKARYTIRATLSGSLPAGLTSMSFHVLSGPSATYCQNDFAYCNPNMNVTDAVAIISPTSISAGQTITIGSSLSDEDMYYIAPINPTGIACDANAGSPALWAFVTSDATIDIICRLDPPEPIAFSATPDPDVSTQINLSWTSGGGTTYGYRLAYQLGASAPADCSSIVDGVTLISDFDIGGSGATSHEIDGLSTGTPYSFRLCSINAGPFTRESVGVTATATTAL